MFKAVTEQRFNERALAAGQSMYYVQPGGNGRRPLLDIMFGGIVKEFVTRTFALTKGDTNVLKYKLDSIKLC